MLTILPVEETNYLLFLDTCPIILLCMLSLASPGACTLKWCDGLRASMTPRAMSVGVSHSGRSNRAEHVCGVEAKLEYAHMQALEVSRCLPSGRGVNCVSTSNDKHGCIAFRNS